MLLVLLCGFAENAQGQEQNLCDKISALVGSYQKQNPRTQIGVSVVNIKTAKSVYSHQSDIALIPASNQKLLTTAFALEKLGTKFKFRTKVFQLYRNIIITGDFDPSFDLYGDTGDGGWVDVNKHINIVGQAPALEKDGQPDEVERILKSFNENSDTPPWIPEFKKFFKRYYIRPVGGRSA